ncbi:MAG: cytochrome C oxidase subunit II [Bacteroidetes bacterium]|nr:cytochrome C oxidase subunit II [Bacteroidota bacterium]
MSQLIVLLTVQGYAAIISLAGAILVIAVVLFLLRTSTTQEDKLAVKKKVYKIRGRYFFALVTCIIILLLVTLQLLPYPKFQSEPGEVVTVVGMQWMWKMAPGTSIETPAAFTGNNEITLPANKAIRFIVTSGDVNHDFAIYDNNGVLVAQTQAMPQYHNELQYVFPQKGDYEILCLEYCGLAHAIMLGKIHVQ